MFRRAAMPFLTAPRREVLGEFAGIAPRVAVPLCVSDAESCRSEAAAGRKLGKHSSEAGVHARAGHGGPFTGMKKSAHARGASEGRSKSRNPAHLLRAAVYPRHRALAKNRLSRSRCGLSSAFGIVGLRLKSPHGLPLALRLVSTKIIGMKSLTRLERGRGPRRSPAADYLRCASRISARNCLLSRNACKSLQTKSGGPSYPQMKRLLSVESSLP